MAKIVSEKREISAPPSTSAQSSEAEISSKPIVSLLGAALTALFLCGAVFMVYMVFQS